VGDCARGKNNTYPDRIVSVMEDEYRIRFNVGYYTEMNVGKFFYNNIAKKVPDTECKRRGY
jgi:hypothetical protein